MTELCQGEAQDLLRNPTLMAVLATMEADALSLALNASAEEDSRRLVSCTRAKAFRDLKRKLTTLAEGKTKPASDTRDGQPSRVTNP